jgi:O-antigen ligase
LITRSRTGKTLAFGYIALAIVNVFGSGCKTAIMGLFAGLAVFFLLGNFRKKWLYLVCLVLGIVMFVSMLPPEMRAKILHKSKVSSGSLEMRYPQFKVAFHMIRDHPIIGVGTGNFVAHTLHYAQRVPGHSRTSTAIIHNGFLQIWAETGTVGFALFLSLFLSGAAALIKVIRFTPDRQMREVSVSIMAAWAAWLVILFLYPTVLDEIGWVMVAMSTCMVFMLGKEGSEETDSQALSA